MGIGQHWLEVAHERIIAGEGELEVMLDYGYISSRSPGGYQDLKDKLLIAESSEEDTINHAARLADALMDINNLVGEDIHVKSAVEKVDSLMREYAGIAKEES